MSFYADMKSDCTTLKHNNRTLNPQKQKGQEATPELFNR